MSHRRVAIQGTGRMVKIGCCGLPHRLSEYVRVFPVVEVQQTFYRLPRVKTVERWRAGAPPGFEFTMKAWQLITHPATSPTYRRLGKKIQQKFLARYGYFAVTDEVMEAQSNTLDVARALGATILVFQCPASFTPTREHTERLEQFFRKAKRDRLRFAWEPRGDWPPDVIERLCRDLDLIHCVDPFAARSVHGTPRYYRLHGRTGYRYRYTDKDLQELLGWCRETTYVMFNNIAMWDDALRFQETLDRATSSAR